MSDLDTVFDNWLHGVDIPADVYEATQEPVTYDAVGLRDLLREAYEAGYDQRESELPRMPW